MLFSTVLALAAKVPHKVTVCQVPGGGGVLASGKKPCDESVRGFRYREKVCKKCGAVHHTKQGPEELTGLEQLPPHERASRSIAHWFKDIP